MTWLRLRATQLARSSGRKVLEAYRRARRGVKPDWYRMAPAVLKIRLLDVTGRRFDPTKYGGMVPC